MRCSNKTINEQLVHNMQQAEKDLTLVTFQREFHSRRQNHVLVAKYESEINVINESIKIIKENIQSLPSECTDPLLVQVPPSFDARPIAPRNYLLVLPVVRIAGK
jgi:hypothetical protein|uniref:Uncharacterized protein n=1 Tax=viral metagenome TaxID=1070528 RepID=A0A6C0IVL5_9ZZZZ